MIKELTGAATRLMLLFAGCAGLAGLLLYSSEFLPHAPKAPDSQKIGPSSASGVPARPERAAPVATSAPAPAPAPAAALAAKTGGSAFVAGTAPPPALPVTPVPPQSPPVAAAPVNVPAFAPVAATSSAGVTEPTSATRSLPLQRSPEPEAAPPAAAPPARQARAETARSVSKPRHSAGARGCTSYRTYNAETKTYRSYDGKTMPCR